MNKQELLKKIQQIKQASSQYLKGDERKWFLDGVVTIEEIIKNEE